MKKMTCLLYVLEIVSVYLVMGVFARYMLEALDASGLHCDEVAKLCSKLFEGPFVTLFGIW